MEQSASIPSVSVSRSRRQSGFWNSDFARGVIFLGGIPVVGGIIAQVGEYDPFLGAFFGTLGSAIAGSGLLILKWHFERPQVKKTKPQGANIKVKFTEYSDGKRYLIDELKLDGVEVEDLEKVAKAVMIDGKNFSRPALRKVCSQRKWHAVKDQFLSLHYAVPKPTGQNGYVLTLRGKALLRKIASLP